MFCFPMFSWHSRYTNFSRTSDIRTSLQTSDIRTNPIQQIARHHIHLYCVVQYVVQCVAHKVAAIPIKNKGPYIYIYTHPIHVLQESQQMDSYVPPVEAYSDKADPEWTDSQPEFPEAAGVGGVILKLMKMRMKSGMAPQFLMRHLKKPPKKRTKT